MITTLTKLGLSDKEIAVYTALLSLGSAPVRSVSELAKVNRGTSYDILKSLRKRIFNFIINENLWQQDRCYPG